jgi:hypothetical protein
MISQLWEIESTLLKHNFFLKFVDLQNDVTRGNNYNKIIF